MKKLIRSRWCCNLLCSCSLVFFSGWAYIFMFVGIANTNIDNICLVVCVISTIALIARSFAIDYWDFCDIQNVSCCASGNGLELGFVLCGIGSGKVSIVNMTPSEPEVICSDTHPQEVKIKKKYDVIGLERAGADGEYSYFIRVLER